MKILKYIIFFILFHNLLLFCNIQDDCYNIISKIKKLQENAYIPKNYKDLKNLRDFFNISDYFKIFKNIKMKDNWELDYIYLIDSGGGYPILFSFQKGIKFDIMALYKKFQNQYGSIRMLDNSYDSTLEYEYMNHIKLNLTNESYFEYIILKLLGNKFALSWHANYDFIEILCNKKSIEDLLNNKDESLYKFDKEMKDKIMKIDIIPKIEINDKIIIITFIIFSPWKGFLEKSFIIDKNNNQIINEKENILIKYSNNIMY